MKFLKLFGLFLFIIGCSGGKITETDQKLQLQAKEFFRPLPDSIIDQDAEKDKIALGERLYFEKKLSINNTISCNSCHNLDNFGVDNQPTSPGHDGTRGGRNSPTNLNAALHFRQFWDGRAKDVEEQALGPILNPIEHGLSSKEQALSKIKSQEYLEMFKKAGLEFNYENIGVAIGAFEKTLLTPSRFDDYLKGDILALTSQERQGLNTFITVGCVSCHTGVVIGGGMYQKLGAIKSYPTKDLGRYEVTKKKRDKYKFKVPSLRNITKTYPYFHDGSIKTLEEAIDIMAEYQLGKKLNTEEINDIKSFLSSLDKK